MLTREEELRLRCLDIAVRSLEGTTFGREMEVIQKRTEQIERFVLRANQMENAA